MNVAPFSIPGLFPTKSPLSEAQIFANPDGSVVVKVWEADSEEEILFQASVTTPDNKVLLMDNGGAYIFPEEGEDGKTSYYFVLDSEDEFLPVGTSRLDVLGNGVLKTFYIQHKDNPFNKGANSSFRLPLANNYVFVIRGNVTLDAGVETTMVQFPRQFSTTPGLVLVNVTKEGLSQPISTIVKQVTDVSFHVDFDPAVPEEGTYRLEWVVWTKSTPLVILGVDPEVGPYHYDP
jgi:hypothetical protein